jgi:hypothetical protein
MLPVSHNKCVCTKIPYKGFEISISMDSSHGDGDLFRSDIRVYDDKDKDVTHRFDESNFIYGTGEALRDIFLTIDEGGATPRGVRCNRS